MSLPYTGRQCTSKGEPFHQGSGSRHHQATGEWRAGPTDKEVVPRGKKESRCTERRIQHQGWTGHVGIVCIRRVSALCAVAPAFGALEGGSNWKRSVSLLLLFTVRFHFVF